MATKYRLRARKEDEGRRRQQSRWNGGAQGATNDSAEFKASVRIVDGYPVEYSCRDDPRQANFNDIDVSELAISFDYEMVTAQSAEIMASTRSLEWSLLWNVARNLGLHNCNYNKQEPLFDGERRLQILAENYVISLSSLELDIIDDDTEFCTFLDNPEEGLVCTPMIGRMTAQFSGDEDAVKSLLERNIEMELNSMRVRIEQVRECHFVGDRSAMQQPVPIANEEIQSKNNTMNLALVFGVLAGVFVLGSALLMAGGSRRRRRRTRQQHTLEDNGDEALPDVPATVAFQKSGSNNSVRQSSSSDTQDSISDLIAISEEGEGSHLATAPSGIEPIPSTIMNSESAEDQQTTIVENSADETRKDTSLSDVLEDKENVDIPPLPPLCVIPVPVSVDEDGETSKSKTLQPRRKRRRKKKKKKQRVLERTSSRTSIDEMETIREDDESVNMDDEGSEYDGSEYSTDDEGETLNWYRESSGGKEAAENSRVSSDPVIPPSPIREEPKIRRLPPPWI